MGRLCRHNSASGLDGHAASLQRRLSARRARVGARAVRGAMGWALRAGRRGRGACLPRGSWRVSRATPREAAPPTSHSGAPCRRRAPGRGTRARTGRAVREFGEAARRGQRRVEPPHLVAAPAVSLWGHLLPFLCCLPCVTSYVVIRKNQARKQTVPHSPAPVPKEERELGPRGT